MTGWLLPDHVTGWRRFFSPPEYIGREVARMTAYEIISVITDVLTVLISFGGFLIALLTFLLYRKKNKRKK